MLILLYGENTYLLRKKLEGIISEYNGVNKSGLNLRHFDFEEDDFLKFKDETRQNSMFKEKKLFVLRNAFSNEPFKGRFIKEGKQFLALNDVIVFYEPRGLKKTDPLFKFLKSKGKIQEFAPFDDLHFKNFVKKEFEENKAEISTPAFYELLNYLSNDLFEAHNEILKLSSFKKGKLVEKEDVEALVSSKIETSIFKTIDAIASKNKKEAFNLLHKHTENGENPLYLFSMITFQFRNLLLVKYLVDKGIPSYSLSQYLKVHPYVLKKSLYAANRFTLSELKRIYERLYLVDFDIKIGKIESKLALDYFLLQV